MPLKWVNVEFPMQQQQVPGQFFPFSRALTDLILPWQDKRFPEDWQALIKGAMGPGNFCKMTENLSSANGLVRI